MEDRYPDPHSVRGCIPPLWAEQEHGVSWRPAVRGNSLNLIPNFKKYARWESTNHLICVYEYLGGYKYVIILILLIILIPNHFEIISHSFSKMCIPPNRILAHFLDYHRCVIHNSSESLILKSGENALIITAVSWSKRDMWVQSNETLPLKCLKI